MVSTLEWNLNHGQRDLRLFEIGKAYELRNDDPVESLVLTVGATGLAQKKTIHQAAREFSFADLKGDLDRIGELAGGFVWQAGGPGWLAGARAAKISLAQGQGHGGAIGFAGLLARRIADEFKLRQDTYVAELRFEPLLEAVDRAHSAVRFKPLPRFRRWSGIFRWCLRTASRSRRWPRRFARSRFRKWRASKPPIFSVAGRFRRANSR